LHLSAWPSVVPAESYPGTTRSMWAPCHEKFPSSLWPVENDMGLQA
jgi:hypothetical protein